MGVHRLRNGFWTFLKFELCESYGAIFEVTIILSQHFGVHGTVIFFLSKFELGNCNSSLSWVCFR